MWHQIRLNRRLTKDQKKKRLEKIERRKRETREIRVVVPNFMQDLEKWFEK